MPALTSTGDALFIRQPYERYSEEGHQVWRTLYARMLPRWERYANRHFQQGIDSLCFDPNRIPKLQDVNRFLRPLTGFQATAVSGYIPSFLFFDCLRNRQFPTTVTIRRPDALDYLPEPDIFHDVAGHVPMHTDKHFAETLVRLGECAHTAAALVSEIRDPAERVHTLTSIFRAMARFFWFTIEFGLMRSRSGGGLRVYGSGLLSSFGEIEHAVASPDVQRLPLQIEQAINQRSSFGLIGIITLTYGATGLFRNLQANLRRIFRDKKSRSLPSQILIGVIMMMGLAILITASIIVSAIFSAVQGEWFHMSPILLAAGGSVIPLAINMIMFALMFRLVPRTKISWRSILPAALVGAFIWEIGKSLFGLYVANLANFGIVYGSLGTVIGLLTWTYLTGCIVSLCAEIAVATEDWRTEQPPAIAVTTPDLNKPANELPASAEGQVMNIETIDGRETSEPESANPAFDAVNER